MTTQQGIPPFDPNATRGPLYRAMSAFVRTRTGRTIAINFSARTDPFLLKVSHGRIGSGLVMPTAGLTTVGAKSGRTRSAAVLYFSDGDDVILVASNFGRERHPAWYHNLKANPEAVIERGGRSARYTAAEVTDEADRQRLFALADKVYAGYADYRERTAAVGRRVPIMRLTLETDIAHAPDLL